MKRKIVIKSIEETKWNSKKISYQHKAGRKGGKVKQKIVCPNRKQIIKWYVQIQTKQELH